MNLAVTAATTMQQIEQCIVHVWPDLRPGRPDWNLQLARYGAFDSFHPPLQDTTAAFIFKADRDINQGAVQRSVFLLSLRTCNLLSGQFVPTILRAFVLDTQMVVKEFFEGIDFNQRCDHLPCALEHNGDVLSPWHHEYALRIMDGDFIQVQAVIHPRIAPRIMGDQTLQGIPVPEELAGEYRRTVLAEMQNPHVEEDAIILATIQFQTTLTSWARSTYDFVNMKDVQHTNIAVFVPEEDNVIFLRFRVTQPLDVFELFFDITEYIFQDEHKNWNFVALPHLDSAFLDEDTQYLGIRHADHIAFYEQDVLCLIEIHVEEQLGGTKHVSRSTIHFQASSPTNGRD